jgi:excinuclease UvrABC ATPase subunit
MSICLVSTILTVPSVCEGYGNIIGIDAELVVPNTTLSVYENAVFLGEAKELFRDELVNNVHLISQFINLI